MVEENRRNRSTIVIRPTEYWPPLASVALMLAADIVILADTFQYSRQSLQNRMRVRNPDGWQWVSVPLKGGQHGRSQSLTRIRPVAGWRKRHWKSIQFNYSQSPYFDHYKDSVQEIYHREWGYLSTLNVATIRQVYAWLGGVSELYLASQLDGAPDKVETIKSRWPCADLLSPATLAQPYSTQHLYFSPPSYRQAFTGFVSGMSILDMLFNYGPESATLLRAGTRIFPAKDISM